MWQWLTTINWVQPGLYLFFFALGARAAWGVLGGVKRMRANDRRDEWQQQQIDFLGDQIRKMLKQKGVKKVTVKRREK